MKLFQCQHCGHRIFFENTHCEQCGSSLGYLPELNILSALKAGQNGAWVALGDAANPPKNRHYCANHQHQVCNWMVEQDDGSTLCVACQFNRYIPTPTDPDQQQAWQDMEQAKHRLMYSLLRLKLPLQPKTHAPEKGLAFDFIDPSQPLPAGAQATTGHAQGQVTINMSEANPAEREQMRQDMNEDYRTLIGHFRHEVGHYYWDQLIAPDPAILQDYRNLFGDETADYSQALERHYQQGAPNDWNTKYVSTYASSHPWEDWAETWAHYFHIIDTLDTAHAFGLSLHADKGFSTAESSINMNADIDPYLHDNFDDIAQRCIALTFAVNSLNRSMGQPDLYPFVLNQAVKSKLEFVHQVILGARAC